MNVSYSGLCGLININIGVDTQYNLTSPGFPAFYPDKFTCSWFLSITDSDHVLSIDIIIFDLERDFDFLTIGYGHDTADVTSVIAKLTGTVHNYTGGHTRRLKYGTTRVLFASTYTATQMKTMYYSHSYLILHQSLVF